MLKWAYMQDGYERKGRKKVLYLVTKGVWGGAQKYVYSLAVNLQKDEYDISVVVGKGNILKNKLEENGLKVQEIKSLERDISIVTEIKNLIEIFKIIKKEKPDVLHLNSPKASGLGAVAGRALGVPNIIQTVHGWSFNENRSTLSKYLIYFFSWLTVMLCHKTIVIAEREAEQALKMPLVSGKKISLIHNGVEQIKFKEKEMAKKDLLFRAGKIDVGNALWIGTVAELHKNKGISYAIEALSQIKTPFVFFIIGEGEERKNLEKLIVDKKLENQVFLLGFMDNANLNLKAFDIFLLTSTKEGLPYTLLEAGLAGLPVVSSSVGGIPDIITSDSLGKIVKAGKVNQIKQAIEYLINLKDEKIKIGENLKEKIEKDFSMKQMLEKTEKLYS
ncbi:MAG: glycosyltransferase family 4 protein [Nitrospira sp.]